MRGMYERVCERESEEGTGAVSRAVDQLYLQQHAHHAVAFIPLREERRSVRMTSAAYRRAEHDRPKRGCV
jgi:hypothetical protein